MKILSPKFGRLSYYYSKARHIDWFDGKLEYNSDFYFIISNKTLNDHVCIIFFFSDDFLTGMTSEFFMLKRANNVLPSKIMSKGKFHMIGRIIQLLEVKSCTIPLACAFN